MKRIISVIFFTVLTACSSVDVTKTGEGFYSATNPSDVEILKTRPGKTYVELGTVTVSGFSTHHTDKMHRTIKEKSAPLGANAVILTEEGLHPNALGKYQRWATGVAIRYTDSD